MARNLNRGWGVPIQNCEGHAKDTCSTIARARRRWPAKEIKFHSIGDMKPHCVAMLIKESSIVVVTCMDSRAMLPVFKS